ncbi:PEP-CTERM sorting domain-containing protein [Massilia sp. UMI-21]|nr:PEP-CTERM sorting domain-containing protein [Massilia sp. UMI-21]
MKIVSIILSAILLTLSNFAHAGVWYKWHATNHVAPFGISLLLEFDAAAVKAGSFQMQIDEIDLEQAYPQSGLLRLMYNPGTEPGAGIHWDFRTGIRAPGPTILNMNVDFGPGNLLTGHIYAHNFDSQFGMTTGLGNGPHFTIYEAESDAGMNGCGWVTPDAAPCSGATGLIRQIPEPGSLPLLALGLTGLLAARRKIVGR